jgi:hypothetical protein
METTMLGRFHYDCIADEQERRRCEAHDDALFEGLELVERRHGPAYFARLRPERHPSHPGYDGVGATMADAIRAAHELARADPVRPLPWYLTD